jgi:ferredoxin/flavodoxin---NADP+ reductase
MLEENVAESQPSHLVAVIGAGPAGLFAARELALSNVRVVIFNRDIKPGGLAEYGIYPDKHRMKDGLRAQFHQILGMPLIDYIGHCTVGAQADVSLDALRRLGFEALLVTVGAQGTKKLGLPGEEARGVFHAKDLVFHYNRLPPFSLQEYELGRKVGVVGAGNVMADIMNYLVRDRKVEQAVAIVRRGPAEVKFDRKEFEPIVANLDQAALQAEIERVTPVMQAVGQDPAAAQAFLLSALPKAQTPVSDTRMRFEFLASPSAILANESGHMTGVRVDDTTLVRSGSDTKAKSLGTSRVIPLDSIIFAIGDVVDEAFGLPVEGTSFVKAPVPRYPQDGHSYEAFDPQRGVIIEDAFVAGWSREASTGLVGIARKDGINGARSVLQYLRTRPPGTPADLTALEAYLSSRAKPFVRKDDLARLEAVERQEAERRGLEEFKFASDEEMLTAMGVASTVAPTP